VRQVHVSSLPSSRRVRVADDRGYFPVLVSAADNSLIAVFRDGAAHMGAGGYLVASRSSDLGLTWTEPVVVVNTREYDDRNPAVGVARNGVITVAFHANGSYGPSGEYIKDRRTPRSLHTGIVQSADNGRTWGDPMLWTDATPWDGMSPYGRMLRLADGTMVMSIYNGGSYLLRSRDNGQTWGGLTLTGTDTNESSYCVLPTGEWLCAGRKQRESEDQRILVRRSSDGGMTWSQPTPFGVNKTLPADLLALSNGSVLIVYGYRTPPFGVRARMSHDDGRTWSETELVVHDSALSADCGYPSVLLVDGYVIIVFYDAGRTTHNAPDGTGAFCELVRIAESELISVF